MTLQWAVRLWLGDNVDWYLESIIPADDEKSAILKARIAVAEGWPELLRHVEYAPATARCLGQADRPSLPQKAPPRAVDRTAEVEGFTRHRKPR
jgi:hypothetical protein